MEITSDKKNLKVKGEKYQMERESVVEGVDSCCGTTLSDWRCVR